MSNGLSLLIDNTTLHRLAFVLGGSVERLSHAELGNVLHLLECLVLSDAVVVNGFESTASHERSSAVLDWLAHSNTPELVTVSPYSYQEAQVEIAAAVAREMDDRGLLLVDGSAGDMAGITVSLGRPRGVVEIASDFWRRTSADGSSLEAVQELAHDAVGQYRTDGLFVYGVAQHGDLVERVHHALKHTQALSESEWAQAHVIFRALFNQRFAELHERAYAPPPVRAEVLRTIYSQPLAVLTGAVDAVAYTAHVDVNNTTFAEELLEYAPKPLPLLGLCFMLEADAPNVPSFSARLYAARGLAEPIRAQLGRLEELARYDPSRYLRRLRSDVEELDWRVRKQLGVAQSGLDVTFDLGVTLNPDSGAPTFGLKVSQHAAVRKVTRAFDKVTGRAGRIAVLSDGIARTLQHGTIEQAVRMVVR
jgi:hypothetical protein